MSLTLLVVTLVVDIAAASLTGFAVADESP